MIMKTHAVLDLFCGAGGMSLGFAMAGFKIRAAVDCDPECIETYRTNFPDTLAVAQDLVAYSPSDFCADYGFKEGDFAIITGGPPCQGFSISGPRKFHDERNRLYLEFIEYVEFLKPRAFVIENVPGLVSLYDGKVKDRIIQEFAKLGYAISWKVLNAADYGVPQNRRRAFFVGLQDNGNAMFSFPQPTHVDIKGQDFLTDNVRKKITLWEAISDLPLLENGDDHDQLRYVQDPSNEYQKLMRVESPSISNHVAPKHTAKTMEIISQVPQGKNYKILPRHLQDIRRFHIAWTRLDGSKPSATIDAGHRHHFHPVANRNPTVRECARLQSFPDKFIFIGSKTSQYRQVGNAVPPLLVFQIAKKLGRCL